MCIRDRFLHRGYICVAICTGIVLVLPNQSKLHYSIPSLLCLNLSQFCLGCCNGFIPLLLGRLRGMCTGRFCKSRALALNGVEHDAGRLALALVSCHNGVINLFNVVAVLDVDHVPAKSVELRADALAMAHNVVHCAVELTLVVVDKANQVEMCIRDSTCRW